MKTKLFLIPAVFLSLLMTSCKTDPNREKVEWTSSPDEETFHANYSDNYVSKTYLCTKGRAYLQKANLVDAAINSNQGVVLTIPKTIYRDGHELEVTDICDNAIDRHFAQVTCISDHFMIYDECAYWDNFLVFIPSNKTTITLPEKDTINLRYLFQDDIQNCNNAIIVNITSATKHVDLVRKGSNVYWNVDRGNQYYSSMKGCLYDKAKTRLIRFYDQSEYTIPSTVQILEQYAFADASKLRALEIPSSVHTIGMYAFYNVSNMEKLVFNEGLKKIELMAFKDMEYKNSFIVFPMGLEEIEPKALAFREQAYDHNHAIPDDILQYIILPPTLKGIRNMSFCNIPDYVTVVFTGEAPSIMEENMMAVAENTQCRLRFPIEYYGQYKNLLVKDAFPSRQDLKKYGWEQFETYSYATIKVKECSATIFPIRSLPNSFTICRIGDENNSLKVCGERTFDINGISFFIYDSPRTVESRSGYVYEYSVTAKEPIYVR